MNNDGNDLNQAAPRDDMAPADFLAGRTTGLEHTHVDSIFYCSGVFNLYTHRSEESEFHVHKGSPANEWRGVHWAQQLVERGTDTLETIVGWCRAHGREAFWSMRMNDQHDQAHAWLFTRWKDEHRDWLMNTNDGYPRRSWSLLDYTEPGVREKVFRILQDVATRYDVDGIELDFFRHPCLFRAQKEGREVTQDLRDSMTELMRRARTMMDGAAATRGRPMLLAVRVPDSVDYCRAMGIDLGRWLSEDLVDIVVGGGYFKLRPWEDLAALGREHDVPVYACFVPRRLAGGGEPEQGTDLRRWRGEALRAWRAGVNGVYTFNRFDPSDAIFREIGDPALLDRLDRTDQESFAVAGGGYLDPGFWLKEGKDFLRGPPS
jgi:hypothetical protein